MSGRSLLARGRVDRDGQFTVEFRRDDAPFDALFILETEVASGAVYRALAPYIGGSTGDVSVAPASEAAARLMTAKGLQRFTLDAMGNVNQAVSEADEGLDYSGLSAAAAAHAATVNAQADPNVQAALDVPPAPPAKTFNDGCAVASTDHVHGGIFLLILPAILLIGALNRRRR